MSRAARATKTFCSCFSTLPHSMVDFLTHEQKASCAVHSGLAFRSNAFSECFLLNCAFVVFVNNIKTSS